MDIKRKNIPDGMRDMIDVENKSVKELGEKIISMYENAGYSDVVTPTLEYYDVFNYDNQTIPEENMYKLTDKSGRLVVLRPDNTTPMARIAATRLKNALLPIKLCYNQNVFRMSGGYSGKRNEFRQTGIEIIGGNSQRADIEAITMAIRTLREISVYYGGNVAYKLEIGHIGFCKAVLESLGLPKNEFEIVKNYVGAKNSSSLDMIVGYSGEFEKVADIIRTIPRLFGSKKVLADARNICEGIEKAEQSLDYVEKLYDILDRNGLSENISIDLSIVNDMEYYTGVVFKGYIDYTGEPVLAGGRYDGLLSNFDCNEAATGFGLNLSVVTDKLSRVFDKEDEGKKRVLVHYDDTELLSKALNYMENCNTRICELSCFEMLEEAIEYAKMARIEKVVLVTKSFIKEVYTV